QGRAAHRRGAAHDRDHRRERRADRAGGRASQGYQEPDVVHDRDQPPRERGRHDLAAGGRGAVQRQPRRAGRDALEGDLRPAGARDRSLRGRGEHDRGDRAQEPVTMAWPLGVHVAKTIGKGVVDPSVVTPAMILAGVVGALLWNLLTWYFALPTSSSHALIGGFAGSAIALAGPGAVIVSGISKIARFIVLA